MNSYSEKLSSEKQIELRENLEADGFSFFDALNAQWRARKHNVSVTLYKTGKMLVQGSGTASLVERYAFGTVGQLKNSKPDKSTKSDNDPVVQIIPSTGIDESGKGDYFGPLVIAGVFISKTNLKFAEEIGLRDSKQLNDSRIKQIAPKIRENFMHSVVVINPAKYNELYQKIANLNKLLAWGHSRVIENIIERANCNVVISDKFANESVIKSALMKKGREAKLIQECKAEKYLSVAAASILARDEFLKRMDMMSRKYQIHFSKGASDKVLGEARKFVDTYGKADLKNIAKIHFKTTLKV